MTATGHAVIGTIIAAKIGNPYLAAPLALVSHMLADMFPHWDTATNRRKKSKQRIFIDTIFDVLVGFLISYLMIQFLFPKTDLLYTFVIVIISQSPDWLMAPYYFFHMKIFKWMYDLQKKFDSSLDKPWGIINQIAILIFITIIAWAI